MLGYFLKGRVNISLLFSCKIGFLWGWVIIYVRISVRYGIVV